MKFKDLKVGRRIQWVDNTFLDRPILTGRISCLDCERQFCVDRDDGQTGGGCKCQWVLDMEGKKYDDIRFIGTNPNNSIILSEEF
jgi:hypothetical protein